MPPPPDAHTLRDVAALGEQSFRVASNATGLLFDPEVPPEIQAAVQALSQAAVLIAGAHRLLERGYADA